MIRLLGLNETTQQTLSITNDGESGSSLIYNIIVEENGSRNITGSTFTSLESDYESDTTFDLHLTIYNASNDDEWLDEATLTFPAGVTVNSSTDFIGGGAGPLESDGETGDGVTITWSDVNGGYGNIYASQSASSTVNITVDSGFSGDLDMDWTLSGDAWGSSPHDISGTLTLTEYTNLTLTSPNGNEFWAIGSIHNITWDHFGAPIANIKLELSSNNGVSYSDITTSTPNDGIYEWTVSGNVSPECLIRISDSTTPSVNDISNGIFRIYNTVEWITLDQDNGALVQGASDNITLRFNSTGLAEGTYNANIEIISNDPDEVTVILPVELIVEDNPLPVTLSNFFVEFEDNISSIFWTTQSELNNMGWNVYRSPSQNFGQAVQLNSELIPGAGTTTEPTEYIFVDSLTALIPGASYWYFLESVEISGDNSLHDPVSLEIPYQEDDLQPPHLPVDYGLQQNYPNPFNPFTRISFNLDHECLIDLTIYDVKGVLVRNLVRGQHSSGLHEYNWDGKDNSGKQMGSGIYLYNLNYGKNSSHKKMILMK